MERDERFNGGVLISTIDECCFMLRRAKHAFNQSDVDAVAYYKKTFYADKGISSDVLLDVIEEIDIESAAELNQIYDRLCEDIRLHHLDKQKSILYRLSMVDPPEHTITKNNDYYAGVEICVHLLLTVYKVVRNKMYSVGNYDRRYFAELNMCIDAVEKFAVEELSEWNHTPADISDSKPGEIETSKKEQLSDFIIVDNKAEIIDKIGRCITLGCKGKGIATIIFALQELSYINALTGNYSALYRAIRTQYNVEIGSDAGIMKYISNPQSIPRQDIENTKNILR